METKRDFEAKAKALISTNPDEAVKLYHELWVSYPDQFNSWDAFYAVIACKLVEFSSAQKPYSCNRTAKSRRPKVKCYMPCACAEIYNISNKDLFWGDSELLDQLFVSLAISWMVHWGVM